MPRSRTSFSALALLTSLALASGPAFARGPAPAAQARVDAFVASDAVAGTTPGVAVTCTEDGALWAAHDADRLLNPASGAKLLTTAAALDRLALDARWVTSVHGDADGGVVRGDLVLVGRGDPSLSVDDLARLARAVADAGVTEVTGDLVVDATAFATPDLPPAYDQKATDASYRPAVSAAGSNHGAITITVAPTDLEAPPTVAVTPPSDAVVTTVRAITVAGKADRHLVVTASERSDGRTALLVDGRVGVDAGRVVVRRRVSDPALLSGHLLASALRRAGVAVAGSVRRALAPVVASRELARHESPPLSELVAEINTFSNNSMAETLFKQLGAGPGGEPATWERAAARASEALLARGLPRGSFRVVNGSGLYDATHITPRALTILLRSFTADDPRGAAFRGSLPVAGETGTLSQRLRTAGTRGRVRAKTGTLDDVTSLSGYVPTRSGCLLAVSIIINDATASRTASLRRATDRLIIALSKL